MTHPHTPTHSSSSSSSSSSTSIPLSSFLSPSAPTRSLSASNSSQNILYMKGTPVLSKSLSSVTPSHPVIDSFSLRLSSSPSSAVAVSAIQALTDMVKSSKATTMMGLEIELNQAIQALKQFNPSSISLAASCELFSRYVTRSSLDIPDFSACVRRLVERGEEFENRSVKARDMIAQLADRFIQDGKTILVHGFSRVVQHILLYAAVTQGKNFSVILTEGRPDCCGYSAASALLAHHIPVTLIVDSAIGHQMQRVDFVLVGAEGVVESGGIINKIGTFPLGMSARAFHRPFYVAAESYKFARLFPLEQQDLPETREQQKPLNIVKGEQVALLANHDKLEILNPTCDYTPPEYITLLFTDLGILTPSAVSDELIKLYY